MNSSDARIQALIERLSQHTLLAGVPRPQLVWLAENGHLAHYAEGELLTPAGGPVESLYVLLSGRLSVRVGRGSGSRKAMEWQAGQLSGLLPYSRMTASPGDVVVEEPTEALVVHRDDFPRLIRECHDVTSVLVHVMLDRARHFRTNELQDEKMRSLGRLAAGLAHELNNPASAAARTAKILGQRLEGAEAAARALGAAGLSETALTAVERLRDSPREAVSAKRTALEAADLSDAIETWLAERGLDETEVAPLADAGYTVAALDQAAELVGPAALPAVVRHLAASHEIRRLAEELATAASRIHGLVAAVKGFTYMDQAAAPRAVDVGRGLSDTVTILGAKAKTKSIDLRLRLEPDLPSVQGFGGELNQVWANLIDNALDAAPVSGHVTVSAARRSPTSLVVGVADDGPGIPQEIRDRIFDPFFTTKRVGEGTGLGLELARRLVARHEGGIEVQTGPGGTEFRVLPPAGGGTLGAPARSLEPGRDASASARPATASSEEPSS